MAPAGQPHDRLALLIPGGGRKPLDDGLCGRRCASGGTYRRRSAQGPGRRGARKRSRHRARTAAWFPDRRLGRASAHGRGRTRHGAHAHPAPSRVRLTLLPLGARGASLALSYPTGGWLRGDRDRAGWTRHLSRCLSAGAATLSWGAGSWGCSPREAWPGVALARARPPSGAPRSRCGGGGPGTADGPVDAGPARSRPCHDRAQAAFGGVRSHGACRIVLAWRGVRYPAATMLSRTIVCRALAAAGLRRGSR